MNAKLLGSELGTRLLARLRARSLNYPNRNLDTHSFHIPPRTRASPLRACRCGDCLYNAPPHSSLVNGPSGLVFVTFLGPIQPIKAFLRIRDRALQSLALTLHRPNCSRNQHGQTGPAIFADT